MNTSNGLNTEEELERHKRWLKDLNIRYKEINDKVEQYEVMIFDRLKPHIGEDEMLIPFIQACERIRGY